MSSFEKNNLPDKELRALPVIRMHKQLPWIEQSWRWQKSTLQTGTIQVRKEHKPQAGYTCRLVTYSILRDLQQRLRSYRALGRQSIKTLLICYQCLGVAFQALGRTLKAHFSQLHPQLS